MFLQEFKQSPSVNAGIKIDYFIFRGFFWQTFNDLKRKKEKKKEDDTTLINECKFTINDNKNILNWELTQIKEEEREQAANLTYLALNLPDGSKTLDDYSAARFLRHLRSISVEDREAVQKLSRQIYLPEFNVFDRIQISNTISKIPQQDRQDVIDRALSLTNFLSVKNDSESFKSYPVHSPTIVFSDTADVFKSVPMTERQSLLDQARLLSDYIGSDVMISDNFMLVKFMRCLASVDKSHRPVIVESAKFFGYAKGMHMVHILEGMTKVLPEDLNQILNLSMKCMNSFLNKILTVEEKKANDEGNPCYYTCHISDYCYPLLITHLTGLSSDARLDFFNMFHLEIENKGDEDRFTRSNRICEMLFFLVHKK